MSDRRDTARATRALVRDVPDFPEPGVVFKDITPLLADHVAFTAVVEALAAAGRDESAGRGRQGRRHRGARVHPRRAGGARLGVGFVPVRKPGKLPRDDA